MAIEEDVVTQQNVCCRNFANSLPFIPVTHPHSDVVIAKSYVRHIFNIYYIIL